MKQGLNWEEQLMRSLSKDKKSSCYGPMKDLPGELEQDDELLNVLAKCRTGEIISNYTEGIWNVISRLDSPIEKAFIIALEIGARTYAETIRYKINEVYYGELENSWSRLTVECQKQFGKYKVDFFLRYSEISPDFKSTITLKSGIQIPGTIAEAREIIVECDGHEFHEKTKEQVAKDKKRDRCLQEIGYKIFRFSGSEIWADAFSCVSQTIEILALSDKKIFPKKIFQLKPAPEAS